MIHGGAAMYSRALLSDTQTGAAVLPGRMQALIKQPGVRLYCCRLLFRLRLFKQFRTAARLSRFKIPVEILSSPFLN